MALYVIIPIISCVLAISIVVVVCACVRRYDLMKNQSSIGTPIVSTQPVLTRPPPGYEALAPVGGTIVGSSPSPSSTNEAHEAPWNAETSFLEEKSDDPPKPADAGLSPTSFEEETKFTEN